MCGDGLAVRRRPGCAWPVQESLVGEGLWSASKSKARKRFELMYEHAAEAKLAFWECAPRAGESSVEHRQNIIERDRRLAKVWFFTGDRENAHPAQAGAEF